MKSFLFSVHDRASGVYDRPFDARSYAEATRFFSDLAVNPDHPIGKHPDDFTLFCVGTWDDNTGAVDPQVPEKLINGLEVLSARSEVDSGA